MKRTQKSHLFPILCNWASKSQPKVLLVYCSSVQCAYRKCCMQWAPHRKPHWHCMMGMVRPSQQEELLYWLPWSIWMSVAECWALGEGCHLLGFQSGPVSWCKWGNRTHREWVTSKWHVSFTRILTSDFSFPNSVSFTGFVFKQCLPCPTLRGRLLYLSTLSSWLESWIPFLLQAVEDSRAGVLCKHKTCRKCRAMTCVCSPSLLPSSF